MTWPDWLIRRLGESPEPLRGGLQAAIGELDSSSDLSDALLDAACSKLDSVRGRLNAREAAFDLLVADGLLTLACEAAATADPGRLAERCQAMGPGGKLGRLASDWAGRD